MKRVKIESSEAKMSKAKKCNLTREEITAYHEAGHAVATIYLYLKFRKVTIIPKEESLGHQLNRKYTKEFFAAFEMDFSLYMLDRFDRIIKVCIAGGIAEKIATGRSNHIGSSSDWKKAFALAGAIYDVSDPKLRVYLKLKHMEAESLVRNHWKDIEKVKDALMIKKTMTSKEVRAVLFPEFANK